MDGADVVLGYEVLEEGGVSVSGDFQVELGVPGQGWSFWCCGKKSVYLHETKQ